MALALEHLLQGMKLVHRLDFQQRLLELIAAEKRLPEQFIAPSFKTASFAWRLDFVASCQSNLVATFMLD